MNLRPINHTDLSPQQRQAVIDFLLELNRPSPCSETQADARETITSYVGDAGREALQVAFTFLTGRPGQCIWCGSACYTAYGIYYANTEFGSIRQTEDACVVCGAITGYLRLGDGWTLEHRTPPTAR